MSRRVVTPEPTPKSSPVASPRRVPSPPITPPGSPMRSPADVTEMFEAKIEAELPRKLLEPTADTEPETSTSVDISEELRLIAGRCKHYLLCC